jgi:hypothetical protein
MIDRQEARSDVARIDPAADRWLHTEYLCSEGGIDCSHSIDDVIFIGIILLRDDEIYCYI